MKSILEDYIETEDHNKWFVQLGLIETSCIYYYAKCDLVEIVNHIPSLNQFGVMTYNQLFEIVIKNMAYLNRLY